MMVDPVVDANNTDIGYDAGLLTVNENCDKGTTDEDIESAIIAECTCALNQETFSDMQDDSSQGSDPSNSVSVSPVSPKIFVPSIDDFVYKATVISDFFRHKDVSADRLKRVTQGCGGGGGGTKRQARFSIADSRK